MSNSNYDPKFPVILYKDLSVWFSIFWLQLTNARYYFSSSLKGIFDNIHTKKKNKKEKQLWIYFHCRTSSPRLFLIYLFNLYIFHYLVFYTYFFSLLLHFVPYVSFLLSISLKSLNTINSYPWQIHVEKYSIPYAISKESKVISKGQKVNGQTKN